MKKKHRVLFSGLLVLVLVMGNIVVYAAPPLSGAIFTTTVDGAIINENVHYDVKEDVYLDGGPGPNAPASAAGLPEGDYYFQVTDPSGKDLLSTDHISCRKIHVNEYGVIDFVYAGTNYVKSKGNWTAVDCQHNQGVDVDHSELGAITVQLYPYDDTPNPGGVYKVWITPVDDYACDDGYVPDKMNDPVNNEGCSQFHGFVPAASKTDNYKVKKKGKPFVSPEITVKKFHDKNANGVFDGTDEWVTGWAVDVTDPLSTINTVYTTTTIVADPAGDWSFDEANPGGTQQTASYLDGSQTTPFPTDPVTVTVAGTSGETHEVVFGNVGLGSITACKYFDANGNGAVDDGEAAIAGWQMQLDGTDANGNTVGPLTQATGADGCTTFDNLLPGSYTVTEIMPASGGWQTNGSLVSGSLEITSSLSYDVNGAPILAGTAEGADFANFCTATAAFGTKGYWHNKNGLTELTVAGINYVNTLAPYSSPSTYFEYGDEPFDGYYENGDPVPAAFNDQTGDQIWAAGTWQSEVSNFLVDSNAGGNPQEQLAQQLLAFIFNTQYRLGGTNASILVDGSWMTAGDLIDLAINAWLSGNSDLQHYYESLLDQFNNNVAVDYIPGTPCAVAYP